MELIHAHISVIANGCARRGINRNRERLVADAERRAVSLELHMLTLGSTIPSLRPIARVEVAHLHRRSIRLRASAVIKHVNVEDSMNTVAKQLACRCGVSQACVWWIGERINLIQAVGIGKLLDCDCLSEDCLDQYGDESESTHLFAITDICA